MTSTASSAKSSEALFASLSTCGLPNTPDAHTFVADLFARAPRKSKHKHRSAVDDGARKQAEREARELSARKYGFLLEEEAKPDVVELETKPSGSRTKEGRGRNLRKREYDGQEWESDEEDSLRKRHRPNRSTSPSRDRPLSDDEGMHLSEVEDEETRKERERLEDLKSRDEFAERVRLRDLEKTKKVVEDRSSRTTGPGAADAAIRRKLADDSEARQQVLPSLRLHSRQEYLTKREIQQIELLRKEIADDEALFSGMKISKRESRELERKKELLKLVEERLKINDKWEGYQLPDDYFTEQGKIDKKKKENVLYQRYEEAKPKDDQFVTDVDQWEASQTRHSTFKMGAMDKRELVDHYEYVFDESQTIKFVMDQTMKGENMMSQKDRMLQQQIEEAEKRGEYRFSWTPSR